MSEIEESTNKLQVVNPFLNLIKIENYSNLYNDYNALYILCNNSDIINTTDIYQYYIDKDVLKNIKKNLILVKAPISLINNFTNKLLIIENTILNEFNFLNYQLSNKNLVVLILNIKYENIKLFLSQYEKTNTLEDVYKMITLNQYLNNFDTSKIESRLESLLNFEDSNYWTYDYKCRVTLNEYFENRKFNLSNKKLNELGCYLFDIHKTKNFTDPSQVLSSTNSKFKYILTNDLTYTKDEINNLFDILSSKNKYLLICNLLCSKKYCHFVLNNLYLLRQMTENMYEYMELFRYLIGYAWMRFYFDESIKKSNINTNDNFIFNINTASELPIFPFSYTNPKLNPYMPIMVSDELLNSKDNLISIPDFLNNTLLQNKGICKINEFKTRLNIFNLNNSAFDLFENINWDEDKIAITGSVMTACLQRYHPLMNLFSNIIDVSDRFSRFFHEYYVSADVDIMFLTSNTLEFMKRVQIFYNQIVVNICKFFPIYAEPDHIKIKCTKIAYLFINENYAINYLKVTKEHFLDIKKSIETEETKKLFEKLYNNELIKLKMTRRTMFTEEEYSNYSLIYPDFVDFDDITFRIRFTNNSNDSNNVSMNISYKYKISSPYINHDLELFNVSHDDFFATVQSFHLPCVRAYYNGDNVYMTPSCITAHLTYMNIDYKYFAGSKDPIEIINKYRMRGFGTWLNIDEKNILIKYSKNNIFWNNLYNINNSDNNNVKLGPLDFNHKIFHPRLFNIDYFYDCQPVNLHDGYSTIKNNKYLIETSDFITEMNKRFNCTTFVFLNNLQTINKNGFIGKLEKWTIEACYNILSNTKNDEIIEKKQKKNKQRSNNYYDISGYYHTNSKIK